MKRLHLLAVSALAALIAVPAAAQTTGQSADPYFTGGQATVAQALKRKPNTRKAKNVILFIGDGMGVSSVTAGRIFEGQSRGVDGESNVLAFERLPYTGLSKTYSADAQVPESAATATALMTGVKTIARVIGLGPAAAGKDCVAARADVLTTLAEIAKARGKSAGVVTTTRLTHATPASAYAHVINRDWEGDADVSAEGKSAGCPDIARQLVEAPEAARLNVAFGGGRDRFTPAAAGGKRQDGQDLTKVWAGKPSSAYAADATALAALQPGRTQHALGLFAMDHNPYEADRAEQGAGVPTLKEMAVKAVDLLSVDKDGYFLMVEGGRIDHANHANQSRRMVGEVAAFSDAIAAVLAKVDLNETLVIVTADHSHGLTINGYPPRGNPILGVIPNSAAAAADGKAVTTLMYATGPGGPAKGETRADPAASDTDEAGYTQTATVKTGSGAHSGEDVPIYSGGPQSHLLTGVLEQNVVFHVMRHAFGYDR